MKKTIQKFILLGLLIMPALILSACEGTDMDLLELAFEAWAEENGLYENGEYKPAGVVKIAVEDTIGEITNAEENVRFDAIGVIRDIDKADQISDEALDTFDTAKMGSAVNLRPEDWRMHEKESVVWAANGNPAAAQTSATTSDLLVRAQVEAGADCHELRLDQLWLRTSILDEAGDKCQTEGACGHDFLAEYLEAKQELAALIETGKTPFCGD